jgi:tetratricopeptide (TPR) repeat protein
VATAPDLDGGPLPAAASTMSTSSLARRRAPRGLARPDRTRQSLALMLALPAALLLGACQGTGTADDANVNDLIREARYSEALELAQSRIESEPADAAAQLDLARAKAAALLDRGRTAVFDEDHDRALELFRLAEEQLPESEVIANWIAKAQQEKAAIIRAQAFELSTQGLYDESLALYGEMLQLLDGSGHPSDIARLRSDSLQMAYDAAAERLEILKAFRDDRGADYYREGVRALREYRTAEAVKAFQASLKYSPADVSSQERRGEVARIQGEERKRIAEELEGEGFYRAAATEYRAALRHLPDDKLATDGLARMELEVTVLNDLREVDRMMRKGEFEPCFAILEGAAERTQLLGDEVQLAYELALEARVESLYETALEYERDFRYLPAIQAFDDLLAEAGGFYQDAISRRDTLQDYVADATDLYARAETATDDQDRLILLSQIELIWPTYRDVADQLETLRAELEIE